MTVCTNIGQTGGRILTRINEISRWIQARILKLVVEITYIAPINSKISVYFDIYDIFGSKIFSQRISQFRRFAVEQKVLGRVKGNDYKMAHFLSNRIEQCVIWDMSRAYIRVHVLDPTLTMTMAFDGWF